MHRIYLFVCLCVWTPPPFRIVSLSVSLTNNFFALFSAVWINRYISISCCVYTKQIYKNLLFEFKFGLIYISDWILFHIYNTYTLKYCIELVASERAYIQNLWMHSYNSIEHSTHGQMCIYMLCIDNHIVNEIRIRDKSSHHWKYQANKFQTYMPIGSHTNICNGFYNANIWFYATVHICTYLL